MTTTRPLRAGRGEFDGQELNTSVPPALGGQQTPDASTMAKFAARLRASKTLEATTEPYVAYGATEHLFKLCASAGDYTMPTLAAGESKPVTSAGEELGVPTPGSWYESYSILPTFNAWAQITFLHMYLLTVRLRMFPADHARHWHQNLMDHFFYAAEDRMVVFHGIEARSVRNKYLKDLFVQWRGVLAAYDEGLIKGDAVMATAVWRNVFGASEDVDAVSLAEITAWMYENLRMLEKKDDTRVASVGFQFGRPKAVASKTPAPAAGQSTANGDNDASGLVTPQSSKQ
ncbi:hypothetical protein MBLNU457_6462t1 [Dothideomycetes sp. NU457]